MTRLVEDKLLIQVQVVCLILFPPLTLLILDIMVALLRRVMVGLVLLICRLD